MQYRITLTNIGKKLISKTFSMTCTLHKSGDIHDIHGSRYGALRLANIRKHLQTLVRNIGGSEIRLNGTERKICALGLALAYAVEKSRFADIRKSDDSAFETHDKLYFEPQIYAKNHYLAP